MTYKLKTKGLKGTFLMKEKTTYFPSNVIAPIYFYPKEIPEKLSPNHQMLSTL